MLHAYSKAAQEEPSRLARVEVAVSHLFEVNNGHAPTAIISAEIKSADRCGETQSNAGVRLRKDIPLQPSFEDAAQVARDLAAEAKNATASLSSDLQQTAKATTRAVKEQAAEFAADVGHEFSAIADEQKVRGVEAMQGFARAITSAATELEGQSPAVAGYVRDAAKQLDGFSNNIRGRSVTELMQSATDLARSQPAVFFAGAMAAGFALSRFLKSSAPDAQARPAGSGSQSAAAGAGAHNAPVTAARRG